jgi:hypothetical protein
MLPESWTHDQQQRPGVPPQLQGLYLPDPEHAAVLRLPDRLPQQNDWHLGAQ